MEEFLSLIFLIFRFTRILCFGNFTIPKNRNKMSKLRFKKRNIATTVFLICLIALIISTYSRLKSNNNKLAGKIEKVSIPNFLLKVVGSIGLVILALNLFIEIKYTPNIWFIICSLCDFDIVVKNMKSSGHRWTVGINWKETFFYRWKKWGRKFIIMEDYLW